jgi:hypothetical protein
MSGEAARRSASKLAYFRASGFVALERFTGDEEVTWLRDAYARISRTGRRPPALQRRDPDRGNREITQIFAPELQCPELLQTATSATRSASLRRSWASRKAS